MAHRRRAVLLGLLSTAALSAAADSIPIQWNGFALLRPQTRANGALESDALSAQIQLGLDWRPLAGFGAHVHLLARDDAGESHRGHVGVVEAYVEKNLNVRSVRSEEHTSELQS